VIGSLCTPMYDAPYYRSARGRATRLIEDFVAIVEDPVAGSLNETTAPLSRSAPGSTGQGTLRECLFGGLECGATEVKSSAQNARCALRRCALRPGDDDDCRGGPRRLP